VEILYEIIEAIAFGIEVLAVLIISIAIAHGIIRFIFHLGKRKKSAFHHYKVQVVRALQMGLDLLIAADIIRTIIVRPTLEGVFVLGTLVVIRTLLSWSLSLEAEGRWPWQASMKSDEQNTDK
jgi:uncharacterized membrane protein